MTDNHDAARADTGTIDTSMLGPKPVGWAGKLIAGAAAILTAAGGIQLAVTFGGTKSASASETHAVEAQTPVYQPRAEFISRAEVEILSRKVAKEAADEVYSHSEERRQSDMKLIMLKIDNLAYTIDNSRSGRRK